jgi:hypothetical protein
MFRVRWAKILGFDSPPTFTLPDHAEVFLALFCSSSAMNRSSIDVRNMKNRARKAFLKHQYSYLGELLKKTVTHPSQFIEHDQLAAFNISLTHFSLHSDLAYDAVPRFFKPFPHGLMEECFEHSSELSDDLWWPPYDPESLACFTEPHDVEVILHRYHRYVFEECEKSLPERSMWRARW